MTGLKGARVLVTGAAGFIGSYVADALRRRGAIVFTVVRRAARPAPGLYAGDLRNGAFVASVVRRARPAFVFHLAATRVRECGAGDYGDSLDDNLLPAARLLAAASSLPALRRVVLIGSSEEYGPGRGPRREGSRENPTNAYAVAKTCTTHLAQALWRARGLPTVVLRPTLVYGPGQPADGMLLPTLVARLVEGRPFAMTSGRQTRDFVYIDDAVDAVLRAATAPRAVGEVLNVGCGRAVRVADAARLAAEMLGRPDLLRIGAVPARAGERMDGRVSIARARETLGWRPAVGLREGLARTIAAGARPLPGS